MRPLARVASNWFAILSLALAVAACLPFSDAPSDEPDFQATIEAALRHTETERRAAAEKSGAAQAESAAKPATPASIARTSPTAAPFIGPPYLPIALAATATPSLHDDRDRNSRPPATPTLGLRNHGSASETPTATAAVPQTATVAPTPTVQPASGIGEERPSILFAGQLMDGRRFDLNDAKGTPTLLVFWSPW